MRNGVKFDPTKRSLIFWSGGVDSTSLLLEAIEADCVFSTISVIYKSSSGNFKDLKARELIISRLKSRNIEFDHHEAVFDCPFYDDVSQMNLWLACCMPLMSNNIEFLIGYVSGDSVLAALDDFKKTIKYAAAATGVSASVRFPYAKKRKKTMWNNIRKHKLATAVNWCENNKTKLACRKCPSCLKHNKMTCSNKHCKQK